MRKALLRKYSRRKGYDWEMIITLRQRPNRKEDQALWEAKQRFRDLEGVSVCKPHGDYCFRIDTEIADMEEIRAHVQEVVVPEDYIRYFVQDAPLPVFLDEIEQRLKFEDFLPEYVVTADIASLRMVSDKTTLLEVTMHADGSSRLFCVAPTYLIRNFRLKENTRIRMHGSMRLYKPHAQLELQINKLYPLPDEDTAYTAFYEQNRFNLEIYEENHPKRPKQKIRDCIGKWSSLEILTVDKQTMEDFESILQSKQIGLNLSLHVVPFAPAALSYRIRNTNPAASALAIIRGPARDRYAFWALNDSEVCEAINESKIPIVIGVGHKEDNPLACHYADYNASTAGTLATRLAYWYAQAKIQMQERIPEEQAFSQNDKPAGLWKSIKHLLPWWWRD